MMMLKTMTNRKCKIKQRKSSYPQSYTFSINVPFKPKDRQTDRQKNTKVKKQIPPEAAEYEAHSVSTGTEWKGDIRPQDEALDEARGLKSGLSWKLAVATEGDPGNISNPSEMEELGLGVASVAACRPFRRASTFFLTRPRRFSNFDVSMEVARRRALLPGLASGLIIHQEDLPVPSFCTRMKRLWRERLWRIEFCNTKVTCFIALLSDNFYSFMYIWSNYSQKVHELVVTGN